MSIFKQIPSISEDTLLYTIYPPQSPTDKVTAAAYAAEITDIVDFHTSDFLWHRDSFELKLVLDDVTDGWILEGRLRVGDCVDDEWFTVWLLREISTKWGVSISTSDSDGEFLLIEAADALPSWIEPENSENRVWIYSSHLHLIPLEHISSPSSKRKSSRRRVDDEEDMEPHGDDDFLSVEDALRLLRDPTVETRAPSAVEDLVWRRISGYPRVLSSHMHTTKAWLPLDVARALSIDPSLVQKAVQGFYTRDAIQLRFAHRMLRFSPEPSTLSSVKMTRIAYAQLLGQKFFPPKLFGRWQDREGTNEWRWRDVGMKIACGFEMMYQESKNQNVKVVGDGIDTTALLRQDLDYKNYIQKLISIGYFKGEMEGSQLWNLLEQKAAETYLEVRRDDKSIRQNFAAAVTKALSKAPSQLPPPSEEDNDNWLNIDADDFDEILQETAGKSVNISKISDSLNEDIGDREHQVTEEQTSRLQNLATKVENFVNNEGDLEGALFEDDYLSDASESDSEISMHDDSSNRQAGSRQAAMNTLIAPLPPSEYGKMPGFFHSNSQRVKSSPMNEDSSEDDDSKSKPAAEFQNTRQPILPRDQYDGVEPDDESDEDEVEDSDDDQPQVVGDVEIDMEEEEEEFLEFSRHALGISDELWNQIIKDRQDRGASLPATAKMIKIPSSRSDNLSDPPRQSAAPSGTNPNLDSFESVMRAMDDRLSEYRTSNAPSSVSKKPSSSKGKTRVVEENASSDDDAAMEAELGDLMLRDDEDDDNEDSMSYGMIKNFLESFKSQAGLSGPVSNLAGRLEPGWKLPRDSDV